jgi:hypothetical protein
MHSRKNHQEGVVEELLEGKIHGVPLISPRSPSYQRARQTRGQPPGPSAVAVGALLDLLEVELAHIRIAEAAAPNLGDPMRDTLFDAAGAARERADQLVAQIRAWRGSPLTDDEVDLRILPIESASYEHAGNEDRLLLLLEKQTDAVVAAYERALDRADLPEDMQDVLSALFASIR